MIVTFRSFSAARNELAGYSRPLSARIRVEFKVQEKMATKIEVFSAGCPLCNEAIELVQREAGPAAEIIVHRMTDARGFGRAAALGVRSVPAVAIDGKLVSCCARSGVDIQLLRDAGLGRDL